MSDAEQALRWQWSSFQALNVLELHELFALRADVFVVEQDCVYQDVDGLDPLAWHLLGWASTKGPGASEQLAGYLRVVWPGQKYEEPSIGRVVTARAWRGRQLGRALMTEGIENTLRQYPGSAIRISAQQHLSRFYGSLGFVESSSPYDEDGIPHVQMFRPCED
ncbi:MAG: GNAT family N-acetyltransferase [Burkholderiaceae bacterium]